MFSLGTAFSCGIDISSLVMISLIDAAILEAGKSGSSLIIFLYIQIIIDCLNYLLLYKTVIVHNLIVKTSATFIF